MEKATKDMTGKEYAEWLFKLITSQVCPSATNLPQETAGKPQKNKKDVTVSKPICGTDDCRKAIHKAEALVSKAITYRETHGYRENLGYDSDHILDDYMETLNLTYHEKYCIRNYFYNLCGKI